MKVELKTWAGLGLATALAGASLAGCADEQASQADTDTQSVETGERGETGEGGEGGESGEGGIAFESAATDPVVYRSGLAIAEAHAIAAKEAFAIGKTDAAAGMFAHPVAEVLADMSPVFEERGVENFNALFAEASQAVMDGDSPDEIDAKYDAIIAALRNAETKAPDDGTAQPMVAAGVVADQIGRANEMYRISANTEEYEPYLDGFGFYRAAEETFRRSRTSIEAAEGELASRIESALALLRAAYPGAERPERLDADRNEMISAHNRIRLSLS